MKDPTMSLLILVQFGLSRSHRSPMNHPMVAQFGPSRSHRNPKVYRKLDRLTLYQIVKVKHARLVMKRLNGVHPISSIWDIAIQNYMPNQKMSPVHKFHRHRLRNLLDWVSYIVFHFLYDACSCMYNFFSPMNLFRDSFFFYFLEERKIKMFPRELHWFLSYQLRSNIYLTLPWASQTKRVCPNCAGEWMHPGANTWSRHRAKFVPNFNVFNSQLSV